MVIKSAAVRRLRRAIVFADLVESVRLMRDHEAESIDRWRRFVIFARDELLPAQGGRLVRTAGDGLLIESGTGVSAVGIALALHDAIGADNAGRPADRQMLLRTGIHVAEVLFDEFEAYGAGVNLAQRLSGLAQPGGTVVSAEVRDDLAHGVHCDIEDLGPCYLKHVDEPVRGFAVSPPGTKGSAVALAAPAEDLRPIVAVVPFTAMPPDPEYDALGHAMADDIIATLSRHPGLRVLSRLSTDAVRDRVVDIPGLRKLLGASFLLGGRFYVRGQRIHLAAELCELREGEVLWTGSHRADVDALFEGSDDLVPQVVAQVSQQVLAHELARVRSLPATSLASYSLLLGASGLINSLVPADFGRARELLVHLADRHPRQAQVHAMTSHWHAMRVIQGWATNVADEAQHAASHARRALDIDPDHAAALVADGVARIFLTRDFAAAQRAFLAALRASPHEPWAWARLSETQCIAGDLEAARRSAEAALSLSPLHPQRHIFESFAASVALVAHRFADAEKHARASLRQHMLLAPAHRVLICALWMSGQQEAARIAAADCLRCVPGMTVGGRISPQRGAAPMDTPYAQALLSAGIPA